MKRLTSSEDCSELQVDSLYLAWTKMKWNFMGEIREYTIDKSDLCSNADNSVSVFFPSNVVENPWKTEINFLNLFMGGWFGGGQLSYSENFHVFSIICYFYLQKYSNGKIAWLPVPSWIRPWPRPPTHWRSWRISANFQTSSRTSPVVLMVQYGCLWLTLWRKGSGGITTREKRPARMSWKPWSEV